MSVNTAESIERRIEAGQGPVVIFDAGEQRKLTEQPPTTEIQPDFPIIRPHEPTTPFTVMEQPISAVPVPNTVEVVTQPLAMGISGLTIKDSSLWLFRWQERRNKIKTRQLPLAA